MAFFRFYNADWSHLPQAIPLAQGGWRFADDVPISILLDLTPLQIARICDLSVDHLHLSASRNQSFADRGMTTIGQLLDCNLSLLLGSFRMGNGPVMVVLAQLLRTARPENVSINIPRETLERVLKEAPERVPRETPERDSRKVVPLIPIVRPAYRCAPPVFAGQEDLEPLTLRGEWELFSGLPFCGESLPLAWITLSEETQGRLRELGVVRLGDILDQNIADLSERLGDDTVEAVLDALTVCAADVRLLRNSLNLLGWVQERDQAVVLAERWGHRSVSELQLSSEAVKALRRAEVATVSELLSVLEPLHVELALDPFAFATIWKVLQTVGLKDESWEDAGERLSAEAYTRASLDHVIAVWRATMPPLRWAIISARLGLEGRRVSEVEGSGQEPTAWQMLTLEEVATKFSITRERVRQIELRFIKRLTGRTDEYFIVLSNTLMMIVSQAGGVISLSQAAEDLSEWINPGEAASEGFCRLILNNSPAFVSIKKNGIYALNSQPFRSYQSIIAAAREVVTKNSREWSITDLAEEVVRRVFLTMDNQETHGGLPSREFVAACLVATGGFEKGFSSPPEVALVRLLREMGSPRHFTELADRLNEKGWRARPVSQKYIHNHLLSRRDLFVYVSAGTYGLLEWGMEDRRVGRGGEPIGDLMVEFLEGRGVPASKEEITAHVLTRKNCRGGSVAQRLLYDERFHQFDKNKYGLSKWTF